eukprot:3723167-Rhodomonas_salina.3
MLPQFRTPHTVTWGVGGHRAALVPEGGNNNCCRALGLLGDGSPRVVLGSEPAHECELGSGEDRALQDLLSLLHLKVELLGEAAAAQWLFACAAAAGGCSCPLCDVALQAPQSLGPRSNRSRTRTRLLQCCLISSCATSVPGSVECARRDALRKHTK